LVAFQREETRGQRVVEPIELLEERGGDGSRLARQRIPCRQPDRGERRKQSPPPLGEVDAQEVLALEAEIGVHRVEERAIEALDREPCGEGGREARASGAADVHVERVRVEAFDGILDRGERSDLIERAHRATAGEAERDARHELPPRCERAIQPSSAPTSSVATPPAAHEGVSACARTGSGLVNTTTSVVALKLAWSKKQGTMDLLFARTTASDSATSR